MNTRVSLVTAVVWLAVGMGPSVALAQQPATISDVLTFLLTNQSVQTGDFVQDQAAALATRDTLSRALLADIATMPLGSSSGGFSYEFNPALGTLERRTATFGPFFVDRALGSGRNRFTLGVAWQFARFDTLDGNNLRNGQFITTANQFRDENQPFDVDALTLNMRAMTIAATARYGVTDRLDVAGVLPFVSLSLDGTRVNTYRGISSVQATASGSAVGVGDVGVQAKYQAFGRGATGFAIAADLRLPTGRTEDLLGAGRTTFGVMAVASAESGAVAFHANGGYAFGGVSDEVRFGGAVAVGATPYLTIDAELFGHRLLDVGRITMVAAPHPTLVGVDTYRLLPEGGDTMPIFAAAGVKWNVTDTWVLDAHLLLPVSSAGLTAPITPFVALEKSFGR